MIILAIVANIKKNLHEPNSHDHLVCGFLQSYHWKYENPFLFPSNHDRDISKLPCQFTNSHCFKSHSRYLEFHVWETVGGSCRVQNIPLYIWKIVLLKCRTGKSIQRSHSFGAHVLYPHLIHTLKVTYNLFFWSEPMITCPPLWFLWLQLFCKLQGQKIVFCAIDICTRFELSTLIIPKRSNSYIPLVHLNPFVS